MQQQFTEEEQGRIFERAIGLQREAGMTSTLSDLQAIALEAGIEPRFLTQAIQEESTLKPAHPTNLLAQIQIAGLIAIGFAQIYIVSGRMSGVPIHFYVPFMLALSVGTLHDWKGVWKGLARAVAVGTVASLVTVLCCLLLGAQNVGSFAGLIYRSAIFQIAFFLLGASLPALLRHRHRLPKLLKNLRAA